ncbi:Cbp1 family collagen-binding glycoprotein adhesin [Luteibaculum oceani]|uniref:Uncharacterized protein n=1 Tax=Luteibaculum oceani TaxID=1294296 RepID=A0A5C6V2B9_9FLAO|nr:hypothetical protein [Luteibaculum oceani]TXC78606.1 hypothetical protein FRX97_07775 [Luteibaculum oceani]
MKTTENNKTNNQEKSNTMKNIAIGVLAVCAVGLGAFALVQSSEKTELKQQLAAYEEQYGLQSAEQMESYREIEQNLASISMHEGNIRENMNLEGVEDPKARISAEIQAIEDLIAKNNQIIEDLNKKVEHKDSRLSAYKAENGKLKTRLETYKEEMTKLEALNAELADNLEKTKELNNTLERTVNNQDSTLIAKENLIAEQDQKLHRAYYLVGDHKELKEKNIVNKEGGILGIAAAKELNPKVNEEVFTEIDLRFLKRIPVYKKNAEIVTNHPSGSYKIVSEGNTIQWIEIKDPAKFWEKSKFLVVATKDSWI